MEQITLDILWNRLVATVNEQAAALMRSSFTPGGAGRVRPLCCLAPARVSAGVSRTGIRDEDHGEKV